MWWLGIHRFSSTRLPVILMGNDPLDECESGPPEVFLLEEV